jgi:probable HAF family extracellular repeat protein
VRLKHLAVSIAVVIAAVCTTLVAGAALAADASLQATEACNPMSSAWDVNDAGTVAGYVGSWPDVRAATCSSENTISYLATPDDATGSIAVAINSLGQVAGQISLSSGVSEAAIWDSSGAVTRLGLLTGGSFSSAQDINDNGWVVGAASTAGGIKGFLWDGSGPIEALPMPSGATSAVAQAINNDRTIAGGASVMYGPGLAVVWQDGVVIALPPLADGATASAVDINDAGQVVGNSATTAPPWLVRDAVLWDDGGVVDLGSLGGSFGLAAAINVEGQIAGYMTNAADENHAFLWEDGTMTLLDPLPGDTHSFAFGMNGRGEIVGISVQTLSGVGRAVRWNPVPQVSGRGRFNTEGNGQVVFTLSNEQVSFDRVRGERFSFAGDVESVTGAENHATLTGTGSWNGQDGYAFEVSVVDKASWGRLEDTIDVVIRDPAGAVVFTSFGPQILKQGDISVTPPETG